MRTAQHPVQLDLSQIIAVTAGGKAQSLHQDVGKHIFDFRLSYGFDADAISKFHELQKSYKFRIT